MLLKHLAFTLNILLFFFLHSVICEPRRKRKKETAEEPPPADAVGPEFNICIPENPKFIACYCDVEEVNQAQESNCWIFNDTKKYKHLFEGFSSQSRIKSLTFHIRPEDGSLLSIPTIAILHLPELQLFEVQYATVVSLESFVFGNSSSLEKILLPRNSISVLQKNAFAHLPSLKVLSLGENHIAEINRHVFKDLPSLEKLQISHNNITTVHDRAFVALTNLQELELHSNKIQVITPDTFKGLKSLKVIKLNNNHLEVIGDMTFQDLESLGYLDLHENMLKYLAPKCFAGLRSLQRLNLQDNKLLSLGSEVFIPAKMLEYLDVSHNVLETLTLETMSPIMKNLHKETTQLFIEGNTFRCDTRIVWMFNLHNSTLSRSIKTHLDNVICYLETGTLPSRLAQSDTVTPPYETTTLDIGPMTRLLALYPSELPDPRQRWVPSAEPDCTEEDDPQKSKSGGRKREKKGEKNDNESKNKTRPRGGRFKPTSAPNTAQNDMAMEEHLLAPAEGSSMKEGKLPGAAPVQESDYSGACLVTATWISFVAALLNLYILERP